MSRTRLLFLPIATVALVTGCADGTTSPAALVDVESARTVYAQHAPNGTHFQAGTSATCTQVGLTISCSSYELAGVGHANAEAELIADYSATVDCRNHGGKVVAVKAQIEGASVSTGELEPKNGRMKVPALATGDAPSNADFERSATCPNGNWKKEVRGGSATLSSWTYTLTFVGFAEAYIVLP